MTRIFKAFVASIAFFALPLMAEHFSWNLPHAKVLEGGDLEWAPEPFHFTPGPKVKYIDFESGNDRNPGTRARPWKHHPWDPAAKDEAARGEGPCTYVFKGGVIYRGSLKGRESGTVQEPIRLTRDPSWGEGPVWLVGSRCLRGGWTKTDAESAPEYMPEPEKVWKIEVTDLSEPWCLWVRNGQEAKRIHLAREPDWEITNPNFVMSNWYTFDGPSLEKKPMGTAENWDQEVLKDPSRSSDFFGDRTRIWTMWSGGPFSAMGTPYDGTIEKYDPQTGTIKRSTIGGAFYFGFAGKDDRYYLERHPSFLDQPGEFYYQPEGERNGTLYLRLPDDADPNQAVVEVALETHKKLIDLVDVSHIEISGLQMSFLNVADIYNFPQYPLTLRLPTGIQIVGNCHDIVIANNRFYHCAKAVQATTRNPNLHPSLADHHGYGPHAGFETIEGLVICDNEIIEADHGAITVEAATGGLEIRKDIPRLGRVEILRNRVHRVNFRPRPPSPNLAIPAIGVFNATTGQIAGNIVTRSWGVGIWTQGGKELRDSRQRVPLIRYMVHHNKVVDSLLATNDWGGIESNTGGPIYIYNNHVGNPVGPHPHKQFEQDKRDYKFKHYAHNGYGIYLDGSSHKKYVFTTPVIIYRTF